MTRGAEIIRFITAFACSVSFVYLTWIGAQYVFTHNVVLDVVDGFVAIAIAWYITRDIISIDDKLRLNAQFSKQH